MKCSLWVRWSCLLLLAAGGAGLRTEAAQLRRGPFLQIATPDSITIRWRTDVACESLVCYGTQEDPLSSSTGDSSLTTEHEVRLAGLTPATKYFYSVGAPAETLARGPDFFFVTHPVSGQAAPTRIWVIGDAGQCMDDGQVLVRNAYYRYAEGRHTDVWLALGDNAYFYMDDWEYQTNFFDVYPEMFRQTPIWSTIGNHETWSVPWGQRIPYLDIFSFPTNGEAGGVPSGCEEYYSFDYANIHFISLDSMTVSRATNGAMANWLREDLAATTQQWIIAFWHHAPYSKGSHDSDDPWEAEMTEMRQNIVPILEAGGVDLVLNGHTHIYERSYLLRGHYGLSTTLRPEMILDHGSGRENETGPYIKRNSGPLAGLGTVYVEAGCAGSAVDQIGHHPVMFYDEMQRGSVVLDINSNRLDLAYLRDNGEIHDTFTVLKRESEPFRLQSLKLQDGELLLCWDSIRGQTYRIERTDGSQPEVWEPASDLIVATGPTTCWTNALTGGSVYFYRAIWLPPAGSSALPAGGQTSTGAGITWQAHRALAALDEWFRERLPLPSERKPLPNRNWLGEGVICNSRIYSDLPRFTKNPRREHGGWSGAHGGWVTG